MQVSPYSLVQPFDKVGGQQRRFHFYILMDEEVELLQTGFFPLHDSIDPVVQTGIIARVVSTYITYEGCGGGETHMHHISASRGIHQHVGHLGISKKLIELFGYFGLKPLFIAYLYGQRISFRKIAEKFFQPVKILRFKVVDKLKESHP